MFCELFILERSQNMHFPAASSAQLMPEDERVARLPICMKTRMVLHLIHTA